MFEFLKRMTVVDIFAGIVDQIEREVSLAGEKKPRNIGLDTQTQWRSMENEAPNRK